MSARWLAAVAATAALALAWWSLAPFGSQADVALPPEPQNSVNTEDGEDAWRVVDEQSLAGRQPSQSNGDRLSPSRVIGSPDCRMSMGRGPSQQLSVVVVTMEQGSEFAVVDAEGVRMRATLDFVPHQHRIGKRDDGTVVAGLGDLRRNSGAFRAVDSREPVRIFEGGHLVYSTEKAWDFDIAPDGSSYVVHEPLAGGASRLVIRNMDAGTEVHHDLGTAFTAESAYEPPHIMSYALDGSEISLYAGWSDAQGAGSYRFFPVDGREPKHVVVRDVTGAAMVSSVEGYFASAPTDLDPESYGDAWEIARSTILPNGNRTDLWRHRIDLPEFAGTMEVSGGGRWLLLDSWTIKVLDTGTGTTVFEFPKVGDLREQVARTRSVDGTAAGLGRLTGVQFRGSRLLFFREFGDLQCSTPPGQPYSRQDYARCVQQSTERGTYRAVYDVYDMEAAKINSQPAYRVDVQRHTGCPAAASAFGGLVSVGGELAYLPMR